MEIKEIYLTLDRQKLNVAVQEVGILQGNNNIKFNIKLTDEGVTKEITDLTEIEIFLYYYNLKKLVKLSDDDITIADNVITVSNSINLVNVNGSVSIQVKYEGLYTYGAIYHVDKNLAYTMSPVEAVSDTLVDQVVAAIGTDTFLYIDMSNVNTEALETAGESVFSKVDISNTISLLNASEGQMFANIGGVLATVPISYDSTNDKFVSDVSIEIPPNTLLIGDNISLHENGGFLEYETKTLDKNYLVLSYENDSDTGSEIPIVYCRGVKKIKEPIYTGSYINYYDLSEINLGFPTFDHQIQAFYFDFINSVTNLKMALEVNSEIVSYFPSKKAYLDDTDNSGYNVAAGISKIEIEPFFTALTVYSGKLYVKADNDIDLKGNDTQVYLSEDLNEITEKHIALEEDICDLSDVSSADFRAKTVSSNIYEVSNLYLEDDVWTTITHNLGYKYVTVILKNSCGYKEYVSVKYINDNTIKVKSHYNVTVSGCVKI